MDVSGEHQVFTLGAQNTWRMIECKCPHLPITQGICKNGVVYYRAWSFTPDKKYQVVVSLDMKSEGFNLMTLPDYVKIDQYANKNGQKFLSFVVGNIYLAMGYHTAEVLSAPGS
ncbi:unnamed protein product [Microthlaspi erraticum]|uniref:F-box associated beta-propeller type 3 domain-containing protein n=1 Tax=Microthlaspi erraticum TaxID=1685480 RepID=A0A6D2KI45_9BRAS|nr:unnamed protein product [Microthlaspi erraticum]